MTRFSAVSTHVFLVFVTFFSGEERFASATFLLEVPDGIDAAVPAAALADQSPYWQACVPALRRTIVVTRFDADGPGPGADLAGRARGICRIDRHLASNTAHIRYATADLLTGWASLAPPAQPLVVAATPYGWFLTTRVPAGLVLPAELRAILAFGRTQQCSYILLDSDGDTCPALPVFPW